MPLQVRVYLVSGSVIVNEPIERLSSAALLSIPTPDHYLPMLYVLTTRQPGELIAFLAQGVDGGSISMLTVQVGSMSAPEEP